MDAVLKILKKMIYVGAVEFEREGYDFLTTPLGSIKFTSEPGFIYNVYVLHL